MTGLEPFINQLVDAALVLDAADGGVRALNPAAERLFGAPASRMLGDCIDLFAPELRQTPQWEVASGTLGGGPPTAPTVEIAARRAEGRSFAVEVSLSRYAQPSAPDLVLALLREPSLHARPTEQPALYHLDELARLSAELGESERRFRLLTESLLEAVFETDMTQPHCPTGVCTFYSDSVETVLGYPPQAWYEDDALFVKGVHPDDRDWVLAALDGLRAQGETLELEYRFVKPSGEVVWILDRSRLERGPNGEPLMMRGTNADITHRKRLESQLQHSEREARALYNAALAIGGELKLEARLERVLDAALDLVGARQAGVALVEPGGTHLNTVAGRGLSNAALQWRIPVQGSLVGEVVRLNATVRSADAAADPRTWRPEMLIEEQVRSWLGVPLSDQAGAFGVLSVVSQEIDRFTEEHEHMLVSLAALVVAAVRQDRLNGEAQRVAVMEERTRLARELHDSATQSLFSASMLAQAAQSLWERDPRRAKERLDRAAELCGGALAEMRSLLYELRPEMLQQEGLVTAVHKHAAARQARDGFVVDITAHDERRLTPQCEGAAYRVVREALHNVSQHAAAEHVWITLRFNADHLLVEVRDDGSGFDVQAPPRRGLGLPDMRTRVVGLGGVLEIESAPNAGTLVRARIPTLAAE